MPYSECGFIQSKLTKIALESATIFPIPKHSSMLKRMIATIVAAKHDSTCKCQTTLDGLRREQRKCQRETPALITHKDIWVCTESIFAEQRLDLNPAAVAWDTSNVYYGDCEKAFKNPVAAALMSKQVKVWLLSDDDFVKETSTAVIRCNNITTNIPVFELNAYEYLNIIATVEDVNVDQRFTWSIKV